MWKLLPIFRKPVLNMSPYSAPLEGRTGRGYLLLDFNERTTRPHSLVLKAIREYASKGNFQMYPEYADLNEVLADYLGVKPEKVFPTAGADQAIDIVTRALIKDEDEVIIPVPTFGMLEQAVKIQGAEIIAPRYKGRDLEFPFAEVIKAIKPGVKLVVICKPNNPTGTPISREQSEAIIKKAASHNIGVLADEAYHEFVPELTVIDLLDKYPNLFIIRTFSKTLGIPALRAGLVVSQKQNIMELRKVRGPYDVSMPAAVAMKALRHRAVREDIKNYVDEVMKVSKPRLEKFYRENGIKFAPSVANFHLLEAPNLYEFMKTRSILIRPRSDPPNTVRVSIGTKENTEKYMQAFKEFLAIFK